jgi:hypothetical protein
MISGEDQMVVLCIRVVRSKEKARAERSWLVRLTKGCNLITDRHRITLFHFETWICLQVVKVRTGPWPDQGEISSGLLEL